MPEGNERPSIEDLVQEEMKAADAEPQEPAAEEVEDSLEQSLDLEGNEDLVEEPEREVDEAEDVDDADDGDEADEGEDALEGDFEGEEDEVEPDPYEDLFKKLGVESYEELVRTMERAKIAEELGSQQTQQPEAAPQQTADAQRQALAAFTDNEYPFVPADKSKLPAEEIEKRKNLAADAFLNDPHGFILEMFGPTIEHYLTVRDQHRSVQQEMDQAEDFLASKQDQLNVLLERGYDKAAAYQLLKSLDGGDSKKRRTPNKSRRAKPKAKAKGNRVRNRKDYKKKKPTSKQFLRTELKKLFDE